METGITFARAHLVGEKRHRTQSCRQARSNAAPVGRRGQAFARGRMAAALGLGPALPTAQPGTESDGASGYGARARRVCTRRPLCGTGRFRSVTTQLRAWLPAGKLSFAAHQSTF